jgi:hypothetical protein
MPSQDMISTSPIQNCDLRAKVYNTTHMLVRDLVFYPRARKPLQGLDLLL